MALGLSRYLDCPTDIYLLLWGYQLSTFIVVGISKYLDCPGDVNLLLCDLFRDGPDVEYEEEALDRVVDDDGDVDDVQEHETDQHQNHECDTTEVGPAIYEGTVTNH